MTTATSKRKDRERKQREELIVTHARQHLVKFGFQGFSIDDLAKSVEYSKGTIYLHFQSKEDIALAVATATGNERAALFERAAKFDGKSRERACALGFACSHLMMANPDYFKIEMMMTSHSFWEKASEERRRLHGEAGARTFRVMADIVNAGMESGDLPENGISAEQIAFGMASITTGTQVMAQMWKIEVASDLHKSVNIVRLNLDVLLDGFGWKLLSSEHDYTAVERRIRDEVFPEATWLK